MVVIIFCDDDFVFIWCDDGEREDCCDISCVFFGDYCRMMQDSRVCFIVLLVVINIFIVDCVRCEMKD